MEVRLVENGETKIFMPHAMPGANSGGRVAHDIDLKRNHNERNEAILQLRAAGWSNEQIHKVLLDCGWAIEKADSINTIARLYEIRKAAKEANNERLKKIREENDATKAKKREKKAEANAETVAPQVAKPPRHPQVDHLINLIEQWPAIAPTLLQLVPIARDAEKWRIAQVVFSDKERR